jgi:hypothetical protein
LVLTALFLSEAHAQAQNILCPTRFETPSLQSPQAASLGKYGEIRCHPVNGTHLITIPLGEIKTNQISVPISLNYNSEGCRPEEHPTWVGLNWNLQAGGVIRRQPTLILMNAYIVFLISGSSLF